MLRYRGGAGEGPLLGLVGKAVTFDSGGYFLKPQGDLVKMKADMGGGAAVIGAIGAIAELELPLSVLAVIPAAENMIGGGAFRPGDIFTTASGMTVEVTNPDAEGRLILADALWYAQQQGATHLVDVATLTGAMRGGMGDAFTGVFTRARCPTTGGPVGGRRRAQRRPRLALAPCTAATAAWSSHVWPISGTRPDARSATRSWRTSWSRSSATRPGPTSDISRRPTLDEQRGLSRPAPPGTGVRL